MTDIADAIRDISTQKSQIKYTIIPAGYRLIVDSWENDADNRRTLSKDGLTLDECKFHLELCQLLKSDGYYTGSTFGNLLDDDDASEYYEAIRTVMRKYEHVFPRPPEYLVDINMNENFPPSLYGSTYWYDYASELIGDYFDYSEGYITRVFEDFKVEYIPEEIKILDVSEQFKE